MAVGSNLVNTPNKPSKQCLKSHKQPMLAFRSSGFDPKIAPAGSRSGGWWRPFAPLGHGLGYAERQGSDLRSAGDPGWLAAAWFSEDMVENMGKWHWLEVTTPWCWQDLFSYSGQCGRWEVVRCQISSTSSSFQLRPGALWSESQGAHSLVDQCLLEGWTYSIRAELLDFKKIFVLVQFTSHRHSKTRWTRDQSWRKKKHEAS